MKRRFHWNLQLFAKDGASGGQGDGAGASGAAGTGSSTGVQFDYEKLAGLLARMGNHLPEPWHYLAILRGRCSVISG